MGKENPGGKQVKNQKKKDQRKTKGSVSKSSNCQICWLGHAARLPDNRTTKKVLKRGTMSKNKKGRSRKQ